MSDSVASDLHDKWVEEFRSNNGARKKRIKETTDSSWVKKHGTSKVDIAHTKFNDLPEDWKAENKAAGKVATTFVAEHLDSINKLRTGKTFRNKAGDYIHRRMA